MILKKRNIFEREGIKDRTRCIFLILFTTVFIARRILSKLAVKIRRSNYRTMHIFHSSLPAIHAKHSCAMAADLTSNFLENIPNIWSSNVETDYVTRRIYLSNRSSRSSVHNLSQPRRNFSWRVAELLENRHYFKITQPNRVCQEISRNILENSTRQNEFPRRNSLRTCHGRKM